ncbi:Centromere/kinetochore Zw10-domain-containing protein [Neohortaea acidophila]|uniref:Centromere/kinetochore Zw10-domain-containing protein n=1 Tax=Neohortaea acidophila TaxID=245834 RepID=A0A6A6PL19_9PEZI|nr:Centromere/kinetochore Zw10-domain-containing protein [Neohortaea acidophila]KAF2480712.1 Centromere/kinetochore Zw10-domain-containing protein [Neohortaea acidophila]
MAAQAVLAYISLNTYPDSESISASSLASTDLQSLLDTLRAEQETTRTEIRSLSKSTAGDIDEWITQAKTLQADILRSRETARQIVADAEVGNALQSNVEEQGRKVGLLEEELQFNETLTGTLEHIQYANGLIDRTQEDAARADIPGALQGLEDAEASILGLQALAEGPQSSRALELLNQRMDELRHSLIETTTEFWNAFVSVNEEERSMLVSGRGYKAPGENIAVSELNLDHILVAARGLGLLPSLVQKLAKDIEQSTLKQRLVVDEDELVATITISKHTMSANGKNGDITVSSLFDDLNDILDFLATHLPDAVTVPLSDFLVPAMTKLLEDEWLDAAIPLNMAEIAQFTSIVEDTEELAERIEGYGWNGAGTLRQWVENAPRTWLTKRREAVLGHARNLVFAGLSERTAVERVETRVLSRDDPALQGPGDATGSEDAWDEAWDDSEDKAGPADNSPRIQKDVQLGGIPDDDDDTSAWDVEEDADEKSEDPDANGDEEDAWGAWDDEDATSKPASPVVARKEPASTRTNGTQAAAPPAEQEMTLRETFTVSAIPDGILQLLQQIISEAETLAGPDYSTSPLAVASQALYTLPTLALAIYRATAPTAYAKVDVGNMLIYNDSLRLAELLRVWQDSRPQGVGRLRLDNDTVALETFAKRAYSSEMESQRTIFRDILDGAQGFGNCTVPPFKQECESAIDGAVARLRDVHKMWKPILSQGALLQSLGSLLSTITTKIISEIEDLGDISEADSHQLHALCTRVTSITDVFTQSGGEGEQDMTFVYCATWLKFQYLAEVLESSLADIKWMWREGELSLEFDADEVVELVEALFAESELRRQAVREIRAGGR